MLESFAMQSFQFLSLVFKVLTPPCLVFAYLVDATIIQRLEFLLHKYYIKILIQNCKDIFKENCARFYEELTAWVPRAV